MEFSLYELRHIWINGQILSGSAKSNECQNNNQIKNKSKDREALQQQPERTSISAAILHETLLLACLSFYDSSNEKLHFEANMDAIVVCRRYTLQS